jgi:uncharacterized protein YgiM (DUF1202 family)
MRVRLAFVVLWLGLLGGPTTSHAEKAKTNQAAKVYNRAGERGEVVVKLKEGQSLTIINKEGRWLKVRVSGRTGYIPRSKVDMPEGDDEIVRNTRRRPFVDGRGTKRGFGGEAGPDDRVGADAIENTDKGDKGDKGDDGDDGDDKPKGGKGGKGGKGDVTIKDDEGEDEPVTTKDEGDEIVDDRPTARVKGKTKVYSEPDADSEAADWTASSNTVLFPTGKKGKFTEVENEEGDLGYVLTSKIEVKESGGPVGGPSARQIDGRARLGVTIIQQALRSNGPAMQPDNYNLSTSAVTVSLGGQYLTPYGSKYMIGGEGTFDLAKAVPGISAPGGQTTGITLYHLNARGLFGIDLKKKSGMMVFARLGLRYQSYQISNVTQLDKNTAKLPSEIITSPAIGAALAIPRLTSKIGMRFSVDAMLVGTSVKQTANLEDGNKAAAKGAILGIGFTYRWKPSMDIQAAYDLNYTKYNFGTPTATSLRGHMATGEIKRTDIFHGVTVGVAKAF